MSALTVAPVKNGLAVVTPRWANRYGADDPIRIPRRPDALHDKIKRDLAEHTERGAR
jgi:hypothetical protein